MELDIEVTSLSEEGKEYYDAIEKIEQGILPKKETPVRYYFENNHPNFPSVVVDYIINKYNVKTIGEFIEKYFDEADNLLETFPEYNDEGLRRALDDDAHEILNELFETVDIGL